MAGLALLIVGPSTSAAVADSDVTAPVLSSFDFTPMSVNLHGGAQQVTVTAHVTDSSGAEAPYLAIDSDTTTQTQGFGQMTLKSGTVQDGTWSRTVSIPTTAAIGSWTVSIYPLSDTIGNNDQTFHRNATKLTVINATAPDAPTGVTAVGANTSADISWTAPTPNGSPITGYTITSNPGSITKTVDAADTSTTVAGLANGTPYTFIVTATNSVGTSTASEPSNSVIPAATAPDAPSGVSAMAGDASATVSWAAPTANGSPIAGYTVTSSPGSITKTVDAATTSTNITGLTNGTSYTFSVTATNNVGTSPASQPSNQVTPTPPPASPTAPSSVFANTGNASAWVSWTASAANGSPITSYTVTSNPGSITKTVDAATTSTNITGLTNGTSYTFSVTATNDIGTSPASQPSNIVIPSTTPSRVAKPSVTVKGRTATVRWRSPGNGGTPLVGYVIKVGNKTYRVGSAAHRLTVKHLRAGRYKVTVRARNFLGLGPASATVRFRVRP